MIQESHLPQPLCEELVEKGMEIDKGFSNIKYGEVEEEYVCTQAQAMRWLREQKKQFIEIKMSRVTFLWGYTIIREDGSTAVIHANVFPVYEMAAEVAIQNCVDNLI